MKTKKFFHVFLILSLCFSLCIPAHASSPNGSSQYTDLLEFSEHSLHTELTVDDLMAHSVITYVGTNSMSGHYNGDSPIVVVTIGDSLVVPEFSWTHKVEFDWTAKTNSSGDYIFNTITNANSSVSPGLHLLYLDVKSTELKDQYSFSSDRKTVTFSSSYELQWRFYNSIYATTATANLKRTIEMQDLI